MLGEFVLLVVFTFCTGSVYKMKDYVSYYEPLRITSIIVPQVLGNFSFQQLEFYAFQRSFVLDLRRGLTNVLHPEAKFMVNTKRGKRSFDIKNYLRNIVQGQIKSEPQSYVHGTLRGHFFQGVIHTNNDTFHIESSDEFFGRTKAFAAVIYRQADVNFTSLFHCDGDGICDNHTMSYLLGPYLNETLPLKRDPKPMKIVSHIDTLDINPEIYTDDDEQQPIIHGPSPVCQLNIVAEHLFYQTIGKRSFQRTMEFILYFVEEVNVIFQGLKLLSTWGNEISFQINTVYIHKTETEPNYLLYNEYMTAEQFLQKLAEYDFDGYCLGVAFAFRQFPKRVLGLAYLADPDPRGTLGGICQERKFVHSTQKSMSYNVAFITMNNRGNRLPKLLTTLSLAHELGHSFGSQHDPSIRDSQCNPKSGSYIMSEQAVEGNRGNNRKFSPCSKKYIYNILLAKSDLCFTIKLPVCGNGIPEAFEECDCGHPLQCEETDHCCTPQGGIGRDAECTYRRMLDSECSPKKDGCCTPTCKKIKAEARQLCASLPCHNEMFCDGVSAQCPYSSLKEERMSCRERMGLCKRGHCVQRVCEARTNLVPCECVEIEYRCHVCCKGHNTSCLPAIRFGIQSKDGMPVLRPAGEPCHERSSTCNQLGDCVETYLYTSVKDTKSSRIDRREYLDGLIIAMIVTLVLLSLGIFVCIVLCFTPMAKYLNSGSATTAGGDNWCLQNPYLCVTDPPSQSQGSIYHKAPQFNLPQKTDKVWVVKQKF